MTNATDIIKQTDDILVNTYNAQPVVMDRGEGVYSYDTDGKKYIDFAAGIAVASLGHAHPKMLETLNTQAARLMTCQASYATKEKLEAAQILIDNSCFDLVYFSNSGTESVEASLKCARKWAYENKGHDCNEIIAFKDSFHGRTYGSASVTEKRNSQPFFAPYLDGVHFAEFNDASSVRSLINENTAAIIVEPVQGEGGITLANPYFLADLRRICDKHNICLIFDEIQAGMGRLGTFFAYESFETSDGVTEPDIACLAKGMGGGFPVGAMVAKKKFGEAITVGTHGTTYGGNPLACAVAATVMNEILSDGFLDHANKVSAYLIDGLQQIQRASNKITEIRGKGLMIGIDTTFDIKELLSALQKNGLMATQAGKATLRLTPPLLIKMEEAQEALKVIDKTIKEMS
ncbi:MAG: aspartate aminotransferase family protein [Alphaproteobacteria bacterium]|nr:MAG: aspartate aminotransferase family protein [Alphaproteobacteria bacterium]